MPQPTFTYTESRQDKMTNDRMIADMCAVASHLGTFTPGGRPQFMEPGLALHITGTTRAGKDKDTSVVNKASKVHGIPNLWLGGNGVIPTPISSNPTLTSICYALHASDSIVKFLNK
jgi:pyranose oxidase